MTVIEALAKEAGWDSARPPYGKFSQYDEFDHVQFAKLIVRECEKILIENVEVALDDSGNPVSPEDFIKEHFGVE